MSYEPYYPGGWQSGESGGTPITPEALKHMDDGIAHSLPATESADFPGCYYRVVDGVTEWINPPMVYDVEYRTTERHNGKVVYTRIVSLGAWVATGTVTLNFMSAPPIRYSAYFPNSRSMPLIYGDSLTSAYTGYVNIMMLSSKVTVQMRGGTDNNNRDAKLQVWYIK